MTRKQLAIVCGIIFILLAGSFFYFSGKYDIRNFPISPSSTGPIIVLGDSLVEGVGASKDNDLVSLLERGSGLDILNLGISGNTTLDGLNRLERDVLSKKPRLVLVLLGGNDFLRRVPRAETFQNLEKIITRIQDGGAVVILLGVRGGILYDGVEEEFKDLAKRSGAFYVPNVLDGLITKPEFMSDAIHPNDKGYERIAKRILPVLTQALEN